MRSNLNFKNFGNDPPGNGSGGGWPPGRSPLIRQSSIYALTFDEFQSTVGGSGKDFGSMNMDELVKSIWNAEENQNFGSIADSSGREGSEHLQRQGSLTLPRTLSQKTVDEVWKNMSKDGNSSTSCLGAPQRQQTLGEITIEEFLARAGVMREECQLPAKTNNLGYFGDLNNSSRQELVYHQQPTRNVGLVGDHVSGSSNKVAVQSSNNLFATAACSSAQKVDNQQLKPPQLPQILPKQPDLSYRSPMGFQSNGMQNSPLGRNSNPAIGNAFAQNAGVQDAELGMVGLGVNGVTVATASPVLSTDGFTKSNGDTSSVSPVPFAFNNGVRGRRTAALEKVVERRQKRMIKNRESAARSRARKQAYTMELEEEVANLKNEQETLLKKQEEIVKMQKNQVMEMMKQQNGHKRQCLRRTQTGPW